MKNLVAWKEEAKRKPLLLLGVRQVGKTYILHEFASQYFPNYHYINFEKESQLTRIFDSDLNPQRLLTELSFYLDHQIDIERDLIIFDEIQACPRALTSLKYFYEELPQLAICGAGSLLGIHLIPVSFPVGKVSFLHLYPMSFEEFLMANQDERSLKLLREWDFSKAIPQTAHEHLWEQLKHYFVVGGMPEAVATFCENKEGLFEAFSQVREKQNHLVTAYYADMAKHSGKINAMHIDRVFKSVPAQLEKEQDGTANKFKFRGVIPGVSHYQRLAGAIDWLVAAGLVIKVQIVNSGLLPFQGHAKENTFKLFLFDIGILGSMASLSPKTILNYNYGSYKGYFVENYVAQSLLCSGIKNLFCWSEKHREVEFLIEEEGEAIPIEVKSGRSTKTKSLSAFCEKYHPPYQILLNANPPQSDQKNGLFACPLYLTEFLFC